MGGRIDQAYVLRTQPLGDADLIVTLFAEHAGRVRGVARSARRSRRRFGGALEPLTRVSAHWTEREGRELHRIDRLDLLRSHARLQSEPALQATCAVMAAIAGEFVREEQTELAGFRLLGVVLDGLERGLDPWIGLRYYEYWTLRLHGVLPELGRCESCGRGLGDEEARTAHGGVGVLCPRCTRREGAAGPRLGRSELRFLREASRLPPLQVRRDRPPGRGRALEQLLRGAVEGFAERPLRAYRHLRMIENDSGEGADR